MHLSTAYVVFHVFPFVCVCCAGAGFLLQSEGAWLSDAKRAGSFGNNQAEPALDGTEPPFTSKMAVIRALHPAPLSVGTAFMLCRQENSKVCTIVGLYLLIPLSRKEYKWKPEVVLMLGTGLLGFLTLLV